MEHTTLNPTIDLSWVESDRERNHQASRHVAASCDHCAECDTWEGAWVDRMAEDLAAPALHSALRFAVVHPGDDPSEYGVEEYDRAAAVPLPSLTDFLTATHPIRVVDAIGSERWYLNGRLHRTDGPAVVHRGGHSEWWVHGRRHRTDGPAISYPDGAERWYLNGKLHRIDGPAVIHHNGTQEWWINGTRISNPPLSTVA